MDPYNALKVIERDAKRATTLPSVWTPKGEETLSIGFMLGTYSCFLPLSEINEIIYAPLITHVPGAKPWVLGVCNVRGQLVAILQM